MLRATPELTIEEIDFIACNDYNPAWKNNYNPNFQKHYYSPVGNSNNNMESSNSSLQETLKSFMDSQNEQNNILVKITENHEAMLGKISNEAISLRNDLQALQEKTRIVEAQLGKITER